MSEDGLITIASPYSTGETLDRLETTLKAKGITVFARIDHAGGAASVGMALRPTELLVFGAPKAGTPLMQERQTVGIDLPLKALAWEDADGKTWLTVNDVAWLAGRHGLGAGAAPAVTALAQGLAALEHAAVG
jgi:uncharacterized protein (DUF302 family)